MKSIKGGRQLLAEARRLESAGRLAEAAEIYQQVVDADPANPDAVERLLILYRKAKEYKKELAVIAAALSVAEQRDKAAQRKWMETHPGAAKLGKEVLRKLGGSMASAYGTDPLVQRLLKRKAFVEKRMGGKGGATAQRKRKSASQPMREAAAQRKRESEERKRMEKERQAEAAAARKAAAEEKKAAAEEKKAAKKAEAETRKAAREAAAEQQRQDKAAKEAEAHPSLFVVSLRYLVPLEQVDAAMKKHVAFLDKHFAAGDFLVSGRQVPRTGGIIIARGKDRVSIQRMMKQDPFVKARLASVDIVEFVASKTGRNQIDQW